MLVKAEALDWLTLTTWNYEDAKALRTLLEPSQCRNAKVMQYSGLRDGQLFWGAARQKNKDHFMLRATGEAANTVYDKCYEVHCRGKGLKCTRIDSQVTVPWDENLDLEWELEGHVERGFGGYWERYANAKGGVTVYIGSRVSGKMWRLYRKEGPQGTVWLRAEMEIKGDHAPFAFERGLPLLYMDAMELPRVVKYLVLPFLEMSAPLRAPKKIRDENRTYKWLLDQVHPALMRLVSDHDIGPATCELIQEWYQEARRVSEERQLGQGV